MPKEEKPINNLHNDDFDKKKAKEDVGTQFGAIKNLIDLSENEFDEETSKETEIMLYKIFKDFRNLLMPCSIESQKDTINLIDDILSHSQKELTLDTRDKMRHVIELLEEDLIN